MSIRVLTFGLAPLLLAPALSASSWRTAPPRSRGDRPLPPLLIPAQVPERRLPVADATTQDEEIQALRASGLDWKDINDFLATRPPVLGPIKQTEAAAGKRLPPSREKSRK